MDKRTSTNGNKVLRYIAKRIAVRDANTTCPFLGYQPELPQTVKQLNKSNRQIMMRPDIKLPQPFASWSNSL